MLFESIFYAFKIVPNFFANFFGYKNWKLLWLAEKFVNKNAIKPENSRFRGSFWPFCYDFLVLAILAINWLFSTANLAIFRFENLATLKTLENFRSSM